MKSVPALPASRRTPRLALLAGLLSLGVLLPVGFLLVQAFDVTTSALETVWQPETLLWLVNTVLLSGAVLAMTMLLAFPLAWLTTRTNLPFRTYFTWLGVLPLALPGYVMAYGLLALGGNYGMTAQVFGFPIPRISGFSGALLALGFSLYPYVFLNLRTALLGLDPALEESARSLGLNARQTWLRVVLPQLKPAFFSGSLLVLLHVVGDFGVVSLMRFRTFSFALFQSVESGMARPVIALLAMMPLLITAVLLFSEARLLKGLRLDSSARSVKRRQRLHDIGQLKGLGWGFMGALSFFTVLMPLSAILFWMFKQADPKAWQDLWAALGASVSVSFPAAIGAGFSGLFLAYFALRYPSFWMRGFERVSYVGYAMPPVVFGLSFVFFSLRFGVGYQTLALLILAYIFHALAEAVGPIRSALYQAPPRLEDAARSLGCSPVAAFFRVTLPLLKRGLGMSMALVFLSVMKELPITLLLAPPDFETLAMNVWTYTGTANFGAAAPYALVIVLFSMGFVGLLLQRAEEK